MKVKILFSFVILLFMSGKMYAQLEGKLFQMEISGRSPVQIEFRDTRYVLHTPDQLVYTRGYVEVKGDTITFTDRNGPMACKAELKGVYRFKYQNSELKFEVIADDCENRKGMARRVWKEVKREKD